MRPNKGQVGCRSGRGPGLRAVLLSAAILAPAAPAWAQTTPAPLSASIFISGNLLVLSALAFGGVALAIAAGLWALAEQRAATRLRRTLRQTSARTKAAVGERDALLGAARESLVVWGRGGEGPFSYGGGDKTLQSCLKGNDAPALSAALEGLSGRGAAFALEARDVHGKRLAVRGRAVGGMATVWLGEVQAAQAGGDFRAVVDALPLPVWLRDKDMDLSWANRAFLEATGVPDLQTAQTQGATLDKTERDLSARAHTQNSEQHARLFQIIDGKRRALAVHTIPLGKTGVIGAAIDVSEAASAQARLQSHVDAHADTLDRLATAVAIFDRDRKLTFYNRAFANLWNLPREWLDKQPAHGDILDRLRQMRRLPEQRDYQAWKHKRLALYQGGGQKSEDNWYMLGGQTIRVIVQPHPLGGLTFLYEDVTARLALESDYNTLMKVQGATLDMLNEGVAVFGPDGKLKLHNAAFGRIWDMNADELKGAPHIRTIAEMAQNKFGDGPGLWDRVIRAVSSGSRGREDFGESERSDRSVLSLNISPLPDGATLVIFVDVTDRFRIERALRERNEGLEAADRLKSDFIKHVSYELRTPLNTILGFAEHMASGVPGDLNPQQTEYIQAIVSGGNTLKNLVNDILDLALVESGAMRLELARIDLHALIDDVATHAREWAAKMDLTLDIDCPPDTGAFLGDARRLRQILFNLLSNAFKFTPRGGRVILAGHVMNDDVQITVNDNGPGLPPDVKASAFERFSAKSLAGNRAGAGLGLALVNRFLELHDGWVEIESGATGGTRVRCHIPRRMPDGIAHPADGDDRAVYL